jgi:hypothetical protein
MSKYYTNELKTDGFGSTYLAMICSILCTVEYFKCEFVYTKPSLSLIYEEEADKYEDIMNLSPHFKSINDVENKDEVSIIRFISCYSIVANNLDFFLNSETMKKLRCIFKENKIVNLLDTKYNNVAIHIRRPSLHKNVDNISEHNEGWDKDMSIDRLVNISPRFNPDSYYLDIINKIRATYTSKKNKFIILSEGSVENFNNFKGDDIEFHINDDVETTFLYMALSDILVISNSAFSCCGYFLNENVIFNKELSPLVGFRTN